MSGGGTPFQRTKRSLLGIVGPDGGSGLPPAPEVPPAPDPTPTPIFGREEEEAKKKVRRRAAGSGRASQIFAGQLNAQRTGNNILKTRLG